MEMRNCRFLSGPPLGYALRVNGETASCGYCGTVVYPQLHVLADHDFAWDGYRVTWFSRAFGVNVHACVSEAAHDPLEASELTSV